MKQGDSVFLKNKEKEPLFKQKKTVFTIFLKMSKSVGLKQKTRAQIQHTPRPTCPHCSCRLHLFFD